MTKKQSKATKTAASQRAAERAAAIRKEQEDKERRRRTMVVGGVVVVVFALILGIGYAVQSGRDTTGKAATVPAGAVDTYAVPVGKASAPVKLTVYEDFMCPFCGQFESESRGVLQKYIDSGDVRENYRVVSFLDDSSTTKYSTRAMNAFAAVLNSSGPVVAKKFHDLLYENQPAEGSAGLSDAQLLHFAVQAGADRAAVKKAMDSGQFDQWVTNATGAFSKAGYTSTPTVLLDGKQIAAQDVHAMVEDMEQQIKAKLS
jgi:protein-disulfide isomerase